MTRRALETLEKRTLLASAPITFGSSLNDAVFATAALDDGGQVVAGTFGGTVDFQPGSGVTRLTSRGQSDIFIARYSVRGKLIWVGQIGGGAGRVTDDPFYSTIQATTGDFENRIGPTVEGQGEYVSTLKVAADTVYVGGSFQSTADFDPAPGSAANRGAAGFHDAFVVKLDLQTGGFRSVITFGGRFDDTVKDLAVAPNGDVIATGYFTRDADFDPFSGVTMRVARGRDDLFVARYDAHDRLKWVYTAGGDAVRLRERDSGEGVALDSAGNIYVTGSFAGKADFDPSRSKLIVKAVDRTDGFLLRLSPRGKLDYIQSFGGEEFDSGKNILIDSLNELYLSGYFSEVADLDPGEGQSLFTAREDGDAFDTDDDNEGVDGVDLFVGRYSLAGTPAFIRQLGGDDYEYLGAMALNGATGGVTLTGAFAGRMVFVGNPGNDLTSVDGDDDFEDSRRRDSSYDAFVARYDAAGTLISAVKFGGSGDDWGLAVAHPADGDNLPIGGIFRNTASFNLATPDAAPRRKSAGLQDAFFFTMSLMDDLS